MTSIPYLPGTSPERYVVVWDAWNRLKRVTYTPSVVLGGSGSSGGSVAGSASYGSAGGSAGDTGSASSSAGSEVASSGSSSSGIAAAPVQDVVYEYDGFFRRTRKRVLAGSTSGAEYYWNLNWKCVVQRYYDTSTVSSVNYYGARNRNDLILKDLDGGSAHSGSCYYALSDAMFSTMAVVRPGFSVVAERYRYTTFGERTIMNVGYNPISASLMAMDTFFHGEQIDEETGWYNYGYRYYVPQLGVWPSRDSIGERGGLNLYGFVKNKPTQLYDCLGRNPSVLDQTIFGPKNGSYTGDENFFESKWKSQIDQFKKDATNSIQMALENICKNESTGKGSIPPGGDETGSVQGIADIGTVTLPGQSDWEATAELGRVYVEIVQPVTVTWHSEGDQKCWDWETEVRITDRLGLDAGDPESLYNTLGDGSLHPDFVEGVLGPQPRLDIFPERAVIRAKWPISGSGCCCQDHYSTL